jgi:hypothetical protein
VPRAIIESLPGQWTRGGSWLICGSGAHPVHNCRTIYFPRLHSYTRKSLKQRRRPRTTNRLPPGRSTRSTPYCSPSVPSATPDTITKSLALQPTQAAREYEKPPPPGSMHQRRTVTAPGRVALGTRPPGIADPTPQLTWLVLEVCWPEPAPDGPASRPPGGIGADQDHFLAPAIGLEPITCRLTEGLSRRKSPSL